MKRNKALLILSSCFLLTGCGGALTSVESKDEVLFSVNGQEYTKEDNYSLLKESMGKDMTLDLVRKLIYDKEVPATDKMKEEVETEYEGYASSSEDFEEQLQSMGYKDADAYKEKVLLANKQAEALMTKYFSDNKSEIKSTYKPSLAIIVQCDDKKTAKEALEKLKDTDDIASVVDEYQSESSSFTSEETLITTNTTVLPTRLINTLNKSKTTGVIDEVFTSDSEDDDTAWVAILKSNNYEKIKDKVIDSLSSDSTLSNDCLVYYLKKYEFEVHDQVIYDLLKVSNPEYLIGHEYLLENEEAA